MKKLSLLLALSAIAGAASAQSVAYSSMSGYSGTVTSTSAVNVLQLVAYDDYALTSGAGTLLTGVRFAGGTSVGGSVAEFDFYNSAGTFVNYIQTTLTSAGNFVYTTTLNSPTTSNIVLPTSGFVYVFMGNATSTQVGTMYGVTGAPTVGSSSTSVGTFATYSGGARNMAFEISTQAVPEPSAFAALGLGVVAVLRRRSKKA